MTGALRGAWRHALELSQEFGLGVFALARGTKIPAIRKDAGGRGCLDATTLAEQVLSLADRFPDGNYGVACGGWSRLFVIDFDRLDAFGSFTERYGIRPPTPSVRTPKPGLHEYYRGPAGVELTNSASLLAGGVDTRGAGGYVVGPGSRLSDGRGHAWLDGLSIRDVPLAPLPDSITLALLAHKSPTVPSTHRPPRNDSELTRRVAGYIRALPSLRDGEGRNETAYRLAAKVYHDWNGSRADGETACDVWNARNVEPLRAAKLAAIIESAVRHGGRANAA